MNNLHNNYLCFDKEEKLKLAEKTALTAGILLTLFYILPYSNSNGDIFFFNSSCLTGNRVFVLLTGILFIASRFFKNISQNLFGILFLIVGIIFLYLFIKPVENVYSYKISPDIQVKTLIPLTYYIFLNLIGFVYLYKTVYTKSEISKYFLIIVGILFFISFLLPFKHLFYIKHVINIFKRSDSNYLNKFLSVFLFIPGLASLFSLTGFIKTPLESIFYYKQSTLFIFFAPAFTALEILGKAIHYSLPSLLFNIPHAVIITSIPVLISIGLIILPTGKTVYK